MTLCKPMRSLSETFTRGLMKKVYLSHGLAELVKCQPGAAGEVSLPPSSLRLTSTQKSDVRNGFLPLFGHLDPAMLEAPTLVYDVSQYVPFFFLSFYFFRSSLFEFFN